ncbi:MAG: hypothetical protein HKN21_01790 [Candidatus Eisenbacteria bacterium]|uniref:DUF3300 domain-containing protein n=1 Tax=Eiseniibacteriota bacterium TaxID=2212470 RepID=A0A7Y2E8Z4_UNCEI|nr:hypothetical protein [Candidatus Eisenbacteria bacterium]
MTRKILSLAVGTLILFAGSAQAVTIDDVIGLTRADASDAIILSQIDADETVFRLSVDDIIRLKEAGVSDHVITYMINTGKDAPVVEEEYVAEPEEELVEDEGNLGDGYSDGYSTSLDDQYRSGVSASFGYYYPHWPGYYYGFYYDSFRWNSWSWYYCLYNPYPYYIYYDRYPWYGSWGYRGSGSYYAWCPIWRNYNHRYYHDGNYANNRYRDRDWDRRYRRKKDGRNVGGRGDTAVNVRPKTRTVEKPTLKPRPGVPRSPKVDIQQENIRKPVRGRNEYQPRTPKTPTVDRPSTANRNRTRQPEVRKEPPARQPVAKQPNRPTRPKVTPSPRKTNVKPAPRKSTPKPAPPKIKPAPRRSVSKPAPSRPAPRVKSPPSRTSKPSKPSAPKRSSSTKKTRGN